MFLTNRHLKSHESIPLSAAILSPAVCVMDVKNHQWRQTKWLACVAKVMKRSILCSSLAESQPTWLRHLGAEIRRQKQTKIDGISKRERDRDRQTDRQRQRDRERQRQRQLGCRQLQRCRLSHERSVTNNKETEKQERSSFTYQFPSSRKEARVEVTSFP